MKRALAPSEQKERETLASRVYAATVAWEAAIAAHAEADRAERDAWRVYTEYRDALTYEQIEPARLAHMLAQSVAEQASKRMEEAWAEREDALYAEREFRAKLNKRESIPCEECGEEATLMHLGTPLCEECDQEQQLEHDDMLRDQMRDYYAERGVYRE